MFDAALVPVSVGACRCSGTPHADGDEVFVYPNLPFSVGAKATAAAQTIEDGPERLAAIYAILTEGCVADWSFVDDKGAKIPVTPESIKGALPWDKGGYEVASALLVQHANTLLRPFNLPSQGGKTPTSISSRTGRTEKDSTSPTPTTKSTRSARSA